MELNLQEISQTAPKIFDCKVYDTILQSAIILFGRESVRNDDRRIVIKDRVNITLLLSWNEQKVYIYTYIGPLGKLQEQTTEAQESAIFENDAYRAALDAVINIEGIIIEVVGSWIWITGTTYPHRAKFSAAGYIFAGAKKAWYFRTEENRTTRSKKGTTLDDIRNKYGSERVNNYKPANRIGGSAAA